MTERRTKRAKDRKRQRERDKGRQREGGGIERERERIIIPHSNTTYILCHVTKRLYRTGPYHLSSSGCLHVPH